MLVLLAACQTVLQGGKTPAVQDPYRDCPEAVAGSWANAQALLERGERQQALPILRRIAEQHPGFVPAMLEYQDLALGLGGSAADEMRAHYMARAGANPGDPVARHGKVRIAPDLASRVRGLTELVDEHPDYYCAHLDLARQYRSVRRHSEALRHYRLALDLEGDWMLARQELAELLVETARYREAVPQLERVLEVRPEDDRVRQQLAELLIYRVGRPEDAAALVERLQENRPADPGLRMHKAAILWQRGDLLAARDVYAEVLRADPDRLHAALNLANLYFEPLASSEPDGREKWWPKARAGYLYFHERAEGGPGYDMLDRLLTAPYRVQQINAVLGPLPEGYRVTLDDLL